MYTIDNIENSLINIRRIGISIARFLREHPSFATIYCEATEIRFFRAAAYTRVRRTVLRLKGCLRGQVARFEPGG